MKKLKKKKIIKINNINYSYFNNFNLNIKKNLYEYHILLNFDTLKIFDIQNKNKQLSNLLSLKNNILIIQQKYNNSILLNYNLTYFILLLFHKYIIKTIIKQKFKHVKFLFLLNENKQIKKFKEFNKQKHNNIIKNKQKIKYFFILFTYLFSIKNLKNIYFKIKKKKFIFYNIIKKKKSTFYEKKMFNLFLLKEEHLKHRIFNIKKKKTKYILSRSSYLKHFLI